MRTKTYDPAIHAARMRQHGWWRDVTTDAGKIQKFVLRDQAKAFAAVPA